MLNGILWCSSNFSLKGIIALKSITAVLLIIIILTGCGSGSESESALPVDNDVEVAKSDLQYFGFAAIDCMFDAPNDSEIKTNFVDEVSGFTNIGQMCVSDPFELISDRVINFSQKGISPILHIESILFEHNDDPTTRSGVRIQLRNNAQARWRHFIELNQKVFIEQNFAALYVVDEPA